MTQFSGPVTPSGRRAERFAQLVDGRAPVGSDSDLALLAVVDTMRAPLPDIPRPRPSSDFSRRLRERLMAEAEQTLVPADARLVLPERTGRQRRRATALAAAFVLVGTSAGIATAAQGSVEGDPLYAVKRGIEAIGTATSLSDPARGHAYLEQSRTRLDETAALIGPDGSDLSAADQKAVADTLAGFQRSAARGSDLLFAGYQREPSSADVTDVRVFADRSMRALDRLSATAPGQLQEQLAQAATLLTDLDQQARVLCAACGSRDPLDMPDTLVAASGTHALQELIDDGTASASTGSPAGASGGQSTASQRTSSSLLGAGSGKPVGSQLVPSGGLDVPDLGSTRSSTGAIVGGGSGGASTSRSPVSRATSKVTSTVPRLVKLPGSQSGAPSVIDLDKTVTDTTGTLRSTTEGVVGGLTGSLGN